MKWTEFSEGLWERMGNEYPGNRTAHSWAVEQYRKLQRWNEELREALDNLTITCNEAVKERDEARREAGEVREMLRDPDDHPVFPWEEEK